MADQCLAASCPAIDCQLLRDFLAVLRPLSMAAVVLSFTCKVAGKRTKMVLVTWVEEKTKTIQSFFLSKKYSFKIPPLTASSVALPALCRVVPCGRHQQDQSSKSSVIPPWGWASPPALTSQLLCGATHGTSRVKENVYTVFHWPLAKKPPALDRGQEFL